jgi:hypothetical protein
VCRGKIAKMKSMVRIMNHKGTKGIKKRGHEEKKEE